MKKKESNSNVVHFSFEFERVFYVVDENIEILLIYLFNRDRISFTNLKLGKGNNI